MSAAQRPVRGTPRDTVFICYSRDDATWMQAFTGMLAPVLQVRGLTLWADEEIRTGEAWAPAIEQAVARSSVALLLVSSRFLNSRYIMDVEYPALKSGGVLLAPVLVGACAHQEVLPELGRTQWLHDPERDGALNLVEDHVGERDRRIWQACERLLDVLPEPPPPAEQPAAPQPAPAAAEVPLGAAAGRLFGVPAAPPGYVARTELARLIEAVSATGTGAIGLTGQPAAFGLHGQGGIGKSVLAAALARDDDVRRRFPDGVHWITVGEAGDVRGGQLDLLERVAPTAARPGTAGEVERMLRTALAERRVLLVVDDVWSVAAAVAFRLTGPGGRVLYTSRDQQVLATVGARVVPIERLSESAALAMAAVLAAPDQDPRTALLPAAAARSIEQVGRVALAVALLAAAVRGGSSWERIAADLERDADVFGDHPYADTFKAMQVGTAELPKPLYTALMSLAVFPRNARIPVPAVIRYWHSSHGISPSLTVHHLKRLAAANLLTLTGADTDGSARIEFHDLQHDYLLLHAPPLAKLHQELLAGYRSLLRTSSEWWQLPVDEPYIWDRLLTHLRGAGNRAELARTATDPAVIVQRLASAGTLIAEGDLAEAADALPTDPLLAWWRAWLPRHTHVLTVEDDLVDVRERTKALVPTMRAWLSADRSIPAAIDPNRLDPLGPRQYLKVGWGLRAPSTAQTRVLSGRASSWSPVSWSPNGDRLATTGEQDDRIRIWDPGSGTIAGEIDGRGDGIDVLTWSPDGLLLTTGGTDVGTVQLWNAQSGTQIAKLEGHSGSVRAVAWHPWGTHLATAGNDGVIRIWDPLSAMSTAVLAGEPLGTRSIAWSPTGDYIAAVGEHDDEVRLWNPRTARISAVLDGHTHRVNALAWSPRADLLATTSEDGTVRLWDPSAVRRGLRPGRRRIRPVAVLTGRAGPMRLVAWSSDGSRLATSSGDNGTVHVWDAHAAVLLSTLSGHADRATALAWSPDDSCLVTTSVYDDVARLWDPAAGAATAVLNGHTRGVMAACWSPDGEHLATSSEDGTVRLWNAQVAVADSGLFAGEGDGRVVVRSPTGDYLAVGRGATIEVQDIASGSVTAVITEDADPATSIRWSPDGARLATDSTDGSVHLWDARTGSRLATLRRGEDPIHTAAWSPDGRLLATTGRTDPTVCLWDGTSGGLVTAFRPHGRYIDIVSWSADSGYLATTGSDDSVRIWDPATGKLVSSLFDPTKNVKSVTWSPDRDRVATTSGHDTVRLWDPVDARIVATIVGHTDRQNAVVWSPTGALLATAGANDGTVTLWKASDGSAVAELQGHPYRADAMAWSADGQWLVTTSVYDQVVRLWDSRTGTLDRVLADPLGEVFSLAWSPAGNWLALASRNGDITAYNVLAEDEHVRLRLGSASTIDWATPDRIIVNRSGNVLALCLSEAEAEGEKRVG